MFGWVWCVGLDGIIWIRVEEGTGTSTSIIKSKNQEDDDGLGKIRACHN